tara:strand:+ start:29187 stop:29630 length:444 start_codon:yes stop_codon:yes gene_type:complete
MVLYQQSFSGQQPRELAQPGGACFYAPAGLPVALQKEVVDDEVEARTTIVSDPLHRIRPMDREVRQVEIKESSGDPDMDRVQFYSEHGGRAIDLIELVDGRATAYPQYQYPRQLRLCQQGRQYQQVPDIAGKKMARTVLTVEVAIIV